MRPSVSHHRPRHVNARIQVTEVYDILLGYVKKAPQTLILWGLRCFFLCAQHGRTLMGESP